MLTPTTPTGGITPMEIAGWLSVLVGVGLLTWSSQIVNSDNAGRRVPFWDEKRTSPRAGQSGGVGWA